MNELADQILSALRAAGTNGLLIDELATRLEITAQKIAATISKLTSEGKVMQKSGDNERYIISGQFPEGAEPGLGDLNGCPCFHCLKISRCGVRQPDSPVRCRDLEEWMITDSS